MTKIVPTTFSMPTIVGDKEFPITAAVKEAFGPYAGNSASYRMWNEVIEATRTEVGERPRNTHKAVAAEAITMVLCKLLANQNGHSSWFYMQEALSMVVQEKG